VTDHSKIGKLSLHTVAPNSAIHTLVTGTEASDSDIKPFQERGITVYRV
ncbi:DeoR family transcriptional regulator, partial [Clostridium perfringens]